MSKISTATQGWNREEERKTNNRSRISGEHWHPVGETEPDTAAGGEAFPGIFTEGTTLCLDSERLQQSDEGGSWMREGNEGWLSL